MFRVCTHCHKEFTPQELSHEETKGMEAERRALGLQGVLFRWYTCSECGGCDIFVDLLPRADEPYDVFCARKAGLEAAIKVANRVRGDGVEAVLVER
jgi:hypothetical protein